MLILKDFKKVIEQINDSYQNQREKIGEVQIYRDTKEIYKVHCEIEEAFVQEVEEDDYQLSEEEVDDLKKDSYDDSDDWDDYDNESDDSESDESTKV